VYESWQRFPDEGLSVLRAEKPAQIFVGIRIMIVRADSWIHVSAENQMESFIVLRSQTRE
jgi:hypothetical protein